MHATGEKTIDSATWRAERATLELYICARRCSVASVFNRGDNNVCILYSAADTDALIHLPSFIMTRNNKHHPVGR